VNQLALSKTVSLALSVTRNTPYRRPNQVLSLWPAKRNATPSNMTNRESFGFLLTGALSSELCAHHLPSTSQDHKADPRASYPFNALHHLRLSYIAKECRPRVLSVSIHCSFVAAAMISDRTDHHPVPAFDRPKACGLTNRFCDSFIDQFNICLIVAPVFRCSAASQQAFALLHHACRHRTSSCLRVFLTEIGEAYERQ